MSISIDKITWYRKFCTPRGVVILEYEECFLKINGKLYNICRYFNQETGRIKHYALSGYVDDKCAVIARKTLLGIIKWINENPNATPLT